MIELIVVIIGALILWSLISRGFRLGERNTAAAEMTAELIAMSAPQEVRDKYIAMKLLSYFCSQQGCKDTAFGIFSIDMEDRR